MNNLTTVTDIFVVIRLVTKINNFFFFFERVRMVYSEKCQVSHDFTKKKILQSSFTVLRNARILLLTGNHWRALLRNMNRTNTLYNSRFPLRNGTAAVG